MHEENQSSLTCDAFKEFILTKDLEDASRNEQLSLHRNDNQSDMIQFNGASLLEDPICAFRTKDERTMPKPSDYTFHHGEFDKAVDIQSALDL